MSVVRPLKTAGTRRYGDEVAAGEPWIKDTELDGDLDTIYAAMNASPAAIPDGAVTTPKLADLSATMAKLGVARTRRRGNMTVDARAVLPTTLTPVLTIPFTSAAGGLCFFTGTLQLEFDGTAQKAAVSEIEVKLDGVSYGIGSSPFTATGTPFVVPVPLFTVFRPAAGPHTLEVLARSAGEAGTQVSVLPSGANVEELE
jgi:hypothetical protein